MVTMISQDLSEFALHARALLGLPVPEIRFFGPSASRAVVVEGDTDKIEMDSLERVLEEPGTQMRIFGKPEIKGHRRMGVILATADTLEDTAPKRIAPTTSSKSTCSPLTDSRSPHKKIYQQALCRHEPSMVLHF